MATSPASVPLRATAPAEDVSVLDALTPVIRWWRLVVAWPLGLVALTAAVSFVIPPVYTASTSFTPIAPSTGGLGALGGLAGLAGLAGQFGLGAMPGANASPDYFAEVLHSRAILTATLLTPFPDPRSGTVAAQRPLIDVLRVKGRTDAERLGKGLKALDRSIRTQVDKQTGIVTLEVRQHWPPLAAAVANRMIDVLNTFNLERRQSQSRAQRQFTEQRLTQAEAELRGAEQSQLRFLETNRRYSESPLLSFQHARLERAVQLKQEVFITLSKAYEEARIAEVRDTPVLTIIDTAVAPARWTSPRRMLNVVVAFFVGCFIGVAAALLFDLRDRLGQGDRRDYQAFKAAWSDARREIASVFRRR